MPDKKSTSKSSTSVADRGPGGSHLGRANYSALQARETVIIFAFGWHPTPGYVDFFEQSPIDIFPPQFILWTIPPGGMVPQVLTPFAIWVMFGATDPIKTVTVHDADGAHEIDVEQLSKELAAAQQATWVSGSVVRGGGTAAPTTMATGEEGPGPTTMAVGEEEGRMVTTMAVGEEQPPITTMALGEESAFSFTPTTLAVGEEDPLPTTLAVGEEGPTTQALGEEDPTTRMVGEEGPTTLALGEETGVTRSNPFGMF
jgi:hypothetical protein